MNRLTHGKRNEAKRHKMIKLNRDAVLIIHFSDEIREDYKECKREAAVPGGPGKNCIGCSLAIPGADECLAPLLEEDLDDEER